MNHLKSLLALFSAIAFFTGCQSLGGISVQGPGHTRHQPPVPPQYKKKGPPPHAPAHGYRHKHQDGHELEYNTRIGAYVVVNIPDTYFGNDLYIRMSTDGTWMVSATLEGGWRVAVGSEVPPRLKEHKRYEKYQEKKGRHPKKKVKHIKKKKYEDDD